MRDLLVQFVHMQTLVSQPLMSMAARRSLFVHAVGLNLAMMIPLVHTKIYVMLGLVREPSGGVMQHGLQQIGTRLGSLRKRNLTTDQFKDADPTSEP